MAGEFPKMEDYQTLNISMNENDNKESDFVFSSIASQSFGD
jgi:hypothetical protein